jgi:hypothetical protein
MMRVFAGAITLSCSECFDQKALHPRSLCYHQLAFVVAPTLLAVPLTASHDHRGVIAQDEFCAGISLHLMTRRGRCMQAGRQVQS